MENRESAGRRLRVAYVYRHYRRTGSIPSLYVDMVERLAKDVDITAFCSSHTRETSADGVSFVDVEPVVHSSSRLGYALECWTFARRVARATDARRGQFDVVHVEGFASTWADLVTVHAVRAAEVDHYLVIERTLASADISARESSALRRPRVRHRAPLLGRPRPCDCPTKSVESDLVRYHGVARGRHRDPLRDRPCPFQRIGDASRERRWKMATPQDRLVLLVVASEFARKWWIRDRHARSHPIDAEFWVLGGDDPRPYARRAASEGVADRVRFLGRRHHEELPPGMAQAMSCSRRAVKTAGRFPSSRWRRDAPSSQAATRDRAKPSSTVARDSWSRARGSRRDGCAHRRSLLPESNGAHQHQRTRATCCQRFDSGLPIRGTSKPTTGRIGHARLTDSPGTTASDRHDVRDRHVPVP